MPARSERIAHGRIARAALIFWGLSSLGRIPWIAERWPLLPDLSFDLFMFGSIPIVALFVWSARCTVCDGGIKLDGRSCARCNHVFGSSDDTAQFSTQADRSE